MVEPAPGFFGKVPALGDFLSRGMPPAFLSAWDLWLQGLMTASQARLGKRDWLAAWLGMPVWHVGFGPGLAGPGRAFGVLIPSVDRVGRNFPFSIVGQAAAGGVALRAWALRAETLALGALEDDFSPARLQAEVTVLGAPAEPDAAAAAAPAGWSGLPEVADWPPPVEAALAGLAERETLFWCRGAERVPAGMLRSAGLPGEQQAAALVAGPAPA